MPEADVQVVAVVVGVLFGLAAVLGRTAYLVGHRRGRDAQRVLNSRLGHGFLPAPSALLKDPANVPPNQGRRDLSGVCSDCGAAQVSDPVAASRFRAAVVGSSA